MNGESPDQDPAEEVTPDETYDVEGTLDAMTDAELDAFEAAAAAEDADALLGDDDA